METIKKHLNLILGLLFVIYGISRIFWAFPSDEFKFDVFITVGFIAIGAYDLYRYFKSRSL